MVEIEKFFIEYVFKDNEYGKSLEVIMKIKEEIFCLDLCMQEKEKRNQIRGWSMKKKVHWLLL